ncbi:transposase family protein [Pseudonocardia sp. HH130630-07]|uniref:transposase family protein n=1 Tax=Pseudonocardia sp. HH130630-07 TaxID=1690815 RepID=UPI00081531D4|nr:transposase family protein [Pseudonocardia sp. HH130630-07]ANY05569.1 transposase [Pseudonocardia sp. HH130630-07]
MLSYPSGMTVSSRALHVLSDALRAHRNQRATRWRKLTCGRQALLVVAHLRKGETYTDLACGFRVGTSTVYRYLREAIELLAAMAPTLEQAIDVAIGKAFVILDGTLLRIDRVGMASGYDRGFYSGKHKCHGLNVQVIADPAGQLVWISPPLPGARHDIGAAREHGIIDALTEHRIRAAADTAYQGAGPTVAVPHRRRRKDPDTGRFRPLSHNQREVNAAHSRRRGPGERVNAELKNWKILRKIRSSPNRAGQLIAAVQTLMIVNT